MKVLNFLKLLHLFLFYLLNKAISPEHTNTFAGRKTISMNKSTRQIRLFVPPIYYENVQSN